jgi:hypothetical protein
MNWTFEQLELMYQVLSEHILFLEWERDEWEKFGWEDAQSREEWEELCDGITEAKRIRKSIVFAQYDGIPF